MTTEHLLHYKTLFVCLTLNRVGYTLDTSVQFMVYSWGLEFAGASCVTTSLCRELVVGKVAMDLILEYRYALRMMGAEPDGPALLLGDNNSVILNCTMPNLVLKKKASACLYHRIREAIASGVMKFSHIPSKMNYADILTKPVPGPQFRELVRPLLFCVPME